MPHRSTAGPRHTILCAVSTGLLACASCAQLLPPDSKIQAKERWSGVRAKLKYELAQESFSSGQFDQAQRHLDDALTLKPDSGEGYVLQAKILLEKGQTASASEALDEALRHGTDTPEMDYLSGLMSQRYNKLDDALAWYRRASEREPMSAPYVVAVGETLVSLGRPGEALELVRARLTDFEQNATLRGLAGGIYMMLGRYEDAANAYREAARISPDDARLKAQLGVALTLAHDYPEAQTMLVSAIAGAETEPSVLTALGRCRLALNEGEEAKDVFRKVVDGDPKNARNWALLARAGIASKDLLTARRAAMQAVQLNPGSRDYRLLLGYVCWAQRDYPATVASLEQVLKGGPDEMALYLLADCYRSTGMPDQAQAMVRSALEINPQCEWARNWTAKPAPRPAGNSIRRPALP